jgi:hypothetical protein
MGIGRQREKGVANCLSLYDVNAICATLDYFNVERPLIQQTSWDLQVPRYRVFDWLAMNIDREINLREKSLPDNDNVWVALGNTYVHTSAMLQFVNSLRYNDYALWVGQFADKDFTDYIEAWDKEDVENERSPAENSEG